MPDNEGHDSRPKGRILFVLSALIGLAALGLLSAYISKRSCERRMINELANIRADQFFIPPEYADEDLLKLWKDAGASFRVHDPKLHGESTIPRRFIAHPRVRAPFILSMEYGWIIEPHAGSGGVAWYIAVFGFTIYIGDDPKRAN